MRKIQKLKDTFLRDMLKTDRFGEIAAYLMEFIDENEDGSENHSFDIISTNIIDDYDNEIRICFEI